ncbi:MAG: hypothetical protein ABSA69_05675 [Verrucomicrobiota bacterium]
MKSLSKHWMALVIVGGFTATLGIVASNTIAQSAPQPVLAIKPIGSNVFLISITNAVSTNAYELHWTPALGDQNYPWTLIDPGSIGQTNFSVDAGDWQQGFFRTSIQQFYNGVPDYELADPNNPSLGPLTVTIDSPINGAVLQ